MKDTRSSIKNDSPVIKKLGDYLKELRKDLGFTLREAARKADISPSHLSKIENGKSFSSIGIRVLVNLSEIYNIPMTAILEEAGFVKSTKSGLPEFSQYLRSKYHFSPQIIRDMEIAKEIIEKKYRK
jgi:transcriptional regulator with XRE-family HTH domain